MQNYNVNLQEQLEVYLAAGHSQEEAAKAIGVTGGLLSSYRKSKYTGNISNVERKLEEFFRLLAAEQERADKLDGQRAAEGYVPTSVSESVYNTIEYARMEKGIAIAHGDAGIGKTMAASHYVAENPNACVYIQASPLISSLSAFLAELARAMRIPARRNKLDTATAIQDKFAGTGRVLIIDEAQHLKYLTLETIRTWGDPDPVSGRPGIGIVLMGNSDVYDRMLGRQEARFAQLFSRTRMQCSYSTRDIQLSDVQMLFPALAKKDKELGWMLSVCQSKWGCRGAVNIHNNAVNNDDTSYKGLLAMSRAMGVGLL